MTVAVGRLAEKTAAIIGGTRGIGAACARMFANQGAKVVVAGRTIADGQAVVGEVRAAGGEAAFVHCDATYAESVEHAIGLAVDMFGPLDILLNNAGGSTTADGPVTTASLDEFWDKMRLDCFATFLGARFVIPHMVRNGGGCIINMASLAGYGTPGTGHRAAYAAAKAAVINLTRTTAQSFVDKGIRVNAIAPGMVGTERVQAMLARDEGRAALDAQPLGLIDPRDIAFAATFLASEEARMITGHVIPIHAGSFAG